jgi:hypothetical protein
MLSDPVAVAAGDLTAALRDAGADSLHGVKPDVLLLRMAVVCCRVSP